MVFGWCRSLKDSYSTSSINNNLESSCHYVLTCVCFSRVANGDTAAQNDSATGSLSEDSYSIQDEETEELMYSVSNPPSPDMNKVKKSSPGGDASDGEHTIVSDNSSQISVSTASGSNVEKANRILNNGTEAMMGEFRQN